MTPERVVLVGRGRMAAAFRRALSLRPRAGRDAAAGRLARPRGRGRVVWVLAVTDAAVAPVARGLAGALAPGDVALHLAGVLGPDALAPARARGCAVGALHPLVAVASPDAPPDLAGGAFLFEGDRAARAAARRLVASVGGRLLTADAVDRARYHGAAALVATGAVALAQGAVALLGAAVAPPLSERDRRAAVASLLRSVAHNVAAVGAERALASPLVRGDTTTVARHLAAMAPTPPVQALYRAAAGVVLDTLSRRGALPAETLARAREIVGA